MQFFLLIVLFFYLFIFGTLQFDKFRRPDNSGNIACKFIKNEKKNCACVIINQKHCLVVLFEVIFWSSFYYLLNKRFICLVAFWFSVITINAADRLLLLLKSHFAIQYYLTLKTDFVTELWYRNPQ